MAQGMPSDAISSVPGRRVVIENVRISRVVERRCEVVQRVECACVGCCWWRCEEMRSGRRQAAVKATRAKRRPASGPADVDRDTETETSAV
jgi:hypothetical protein